MTARNTRLYRKLAGRGFRPTHAVEVGVYRPDTSNIEGYVNDGVRCTLVEPDPEALDLIHRRWSGHSNVTVCPVAVFDRCAEIELTKRKASTFVSALPYSPATENDGCIREESQKMRVQAVTFDQIDDGTIDLLSIDIEGSEWHVLRHMTSRPAIIAVETHGGIYVNPFIGEIESWMQANRYTLWYKDKSDSVYVRDSAVAIGLSDAVGLLLTNGRLWLRRTRKTAVRSLMRRWKSRR